MRTIRARDHMCLCVDTLVNRVPPRLRATIYRAYAPCIIRAKRTKPIFYGELYGLCTLCHMDTTLQEGIVFWGVEYLG
jgi:hypothetical protein